MLDSINIDIERIIPEKSSFLSISPFDKGKFLIHESELNKRITVGLHVKILLDFIDGKRDLKDISQITSTELGINLSVNEVFEILFNSLANYGIIKSKKKIKKANVNDYINFKIKLFSKQTINKMNKFFGFLYHPKYFFIIMLVMLVFNISFLFNEFYLKSIYDTLSITSLVIIKLIFIAGMFLHELGHATACRRLNAEHGEIGFGFYMLRPALYTDVSDAWKLKSRERLIIDLGGFQIQILYASFFSVLYFFTGYPLFLVVNFLILLVIVRNLNPFFRYDGYWALCDLLKITNLRQKSTNKLIEFFSFLRKRDNSPLKSFGDFGLLFYGLISWSFFVMFIALLVLWNPKSIIYYPINIYIFFKHIILNYGNLQYEWFQNSLKEIIAPTIFYWIIIKLLIRKTLNFKALFRF